MLALKTEMEVALELAARVRTTRLQLGWSQDELARRAGLRPSTYRLFEQTGRIVSGGMKLIFFGRFETHGFFGGFSSAASLKKVLLHRVDFLPS